MPGCRGLPLLLAVLGALAGLATRIPAAPGRTQDPAAGDDQAARLQELLRALEQEGATPPAGAEASGDEAPAIHLYRTSDPVQWVRAGVVRDLHFWDAHQTLLGGDELRVGTSGRVLIDYPDGSTFTFDGMAVARPLSGPADDPRRLGVPVLQRFASLVLYETPCLVELPGGNVLVASNTKLAVRRVDLHALEVKNSGPSPAWVGGPFLGDELVEVTGGQRVFLPVLPLVGGGPAGPTTDVEAGPMRVRLPDGAAADWRDPELRLDGPADLPAVASVSGTRVVLRPGVPWLLRRAPLGPPLSGER